MICVTTLQYMFDYCFHPTDEKTEDQLIQLTQDPIAKVMGGIQFQAV